MKHVILDFYFALNNIIRAIGKILVRAIDYSILSTLNCLDLVNYTEVMYKNILIFLCLEYLKEYSDF